MGTKILRSQSRLVKINSSPQPKRETNEIRSKNRKKIKLELEQDVKSESMTVAINEPPKKKRNRKTVMKIKPEIDTSNIEKPLKLGDKYVGAHTSIVGGLENSVFDAVKMGAKAFGLFLRNQRQWKCKPLEDNVIEDFKKACMDYDYPSHLILPHGSYLLNCGAPNEETLEKSRDTLIDELQRCEKLGITLYNFHPGSTCGKMTVDECVKKIAESINLAHCKSRSVTTVIENMSCQGNTIGGDFKELKAIIDLVEDKTRVGVCLDTCHAFAAGYNLATDEGYQLMMSDFDSIVGFEYLKALHFNDSKGKVGSHLDRHENIGKGFIGIKGFKRFMNDLRFNNIPIILETPWISDDVNAKEIALLYSLID